MKAVEEKNMKKMKNRKNEILFYKTENLIIESLPELSNDHKRSPSPKKSGSKARNKTIIKDKKRKKYLVTFIPKSKDLAV